MYLSNSALPCVAMYFPKKTEGDTHSVSASVGQAKTQNVNCTRNGARQFHESESTAMLKQHAVDIAAAHSSSPSTSACVSRHMSRCAASAVYACLSMHVCVREITSILSIIFPITRL